MKIRKGLYSSERVVFAIIFLIWIIFGVEQSKAQPSFYPHDNPMLSSDGQDAHRESFDLGLTEAQKKTRESLQQAYTSEVLALRMELVSLKFELRYLIRGPNVRPKILLDRQKKISELQAKLDELSLSYQIKIRAIFTKQQLEQLPPDFSIGMELPGMGIGTGKGLRQTIR
jgi:hypothetical protein